MTTIGAFLAAIGMEQYEPEMTELGWDDPPFFASLGEDDFALMDAGLKEKGVKVGHILRIIKAVRAAGLASPPMAGTATAPTPEYALPISRADAATGAAPVPPPMAGGRARGTIKSFDKDKNTGFIVPQQGGPDVFVRSQWVQKGGGTLASGEKVEFTLQIESSGPQKDKPQAREVVLLDANGCCVVPPPPPAPPPPAAGSRVKGTIKSFDKAKGFGFITPLQGGPDVFVHQKFVDCDPAMLKANSPLEFTVGLNAEGKPQAYQAVLLDEHGRPILEDTASRGVSGQALLPGEKEARQSKTVRKWTLNASRSTEGTPEESHFRFAESAWCRGGGAAAQIASVEYCFNPTLEAAWNKKRQEYDAKFGKGNHTILFAFHGTKPANVDSIIAGGFKLSKLGLNTGNTGAYGAGVYFSEQLATSHGYNSGNNGMFLCKLLVGKPYQTRAQTGRGLEPGYTSHVSDPNGGEVVIFDEAAMLPVYIIRMNGAAVSTLMPAAKEALKGLGS